MEKRDDRADAVDPLRQDVDEKTQPLPPVEADAAPGDRRKDDHADINTGYPPVREPGWDQVAEAREETDRLETQDGLT